MAETTKTTKKRKNIPGGLFTVYLDDDLTIIRANDYFYQLFGYTRVEAEKEGFNNLRHRVPSQDQEHLRKYIIRGIQEKREEFDVEFQGIHKNNSNLWLLARGQYDETTNEMKGILLDITKRKTRLESQTIAELEKTKLELKNQYYRDSLTGLLNRKGIMEAFDLLIEDQSDKQHGFLMLDLDDFKIHNDCSGHVFGDKILEEVSKELLGLFRENDIIGRLGGDEFIAIITGIPGEETIKKKAQVIHDKLERVLENGQHLSTSQGIALYPKDGTTFMDLYNKADAALYEAKNNGKSQYVFYSGSPRTITSGGMGDKRSYVPYQETLSEEKEIVEEQKEIKEMYRWGLEKARVAFWEYDIDETSFTNNLGQIFENDEGMVSAGKIHKDSVKEISRLRQEVKSGSKEGEIFVKGLGPNRNFEWLKVSYRTFVGKDKETLRVFAVAEVLPGETRSKIRYIREEWIRRELTLMGIKVYISNLSLDRVETTTRESSTSKILVADKLVKTYEDLLKALGDGFVRTSKSEEFVRTFAFEELVYNFQKGRDSLKEMVQMKDAKGKLIWVTIYNRVIIHPETGDYYSYIYLKEDDEVARQENASVEPLLIDAMTDFYDEALLSKAVNKALKNNKEKKEYGMIILDMVNYSSQKSQMGDTIFAQVFSRIAEDFRLIFPSRHICAVKDKGEFVFFLEEDKNTSIREVSEKLLEKLKTLFLMVDPKGTFIFYGGIACHSQGQNYNELYENAYIARNMATRGENWSYALYWNQEKEIQSTGLVLEEAVSFAKNQMGLINDDKFTSIEDREMVQTSLLCLKNFVERQDIEAALFNACKILADYYFADGVFITEIKEASREESLTLKWERGKNSFSKERDHQENHEYMEIFLQAYRQKEGFTSNNIVAVPFLIDGFFSGFLGVVKPFRRTRDLRLLNTTAHIIGAGLYRIVLREGRDYHCIYGDKTGLYNRNEYILSLESLQSQGLSSLGVISLELNHSQDKNTLQEIKDFDNKILQTAQAIKSLCQECQAYHVDQGEFIVLCKDFTLDLFISLTTKIRMSLNLNLTGLVSLGYCWSGEDIDIERLLQHAGELRRIDSLRFREGFLENQGKNRDEHLGELLEDIKNKRYLILIQPIINSKTDKTSGGEALVRRVDEEGMLQLPIEFIRKYEVAGLIRYIDLFVLEEVCKILKEWMREGVDVVPISVNFSRETLLEPDIISGLISISEKYQVPRELIEIEVTERLGDAEESTIMGIAQSIKESGFGLSLDDFGTEYSNLSVVSRLKLDTLKIDRSLTSQIHENKTTEVIIRSVLQLCKELDIESVAEGVENKFQIDDLRSWGCDYLQGFYYSKALAPEDFKSKYLHYKDL